MVLFPGLAERHKPEFPPILPQGFHRVTMDDLKKVCVEAFPESQRRPMIMAGLERMIAKLTAVGLDDCEMWIDGSFLTKKAEPDDADFVVFAPAKFWDHGTKEQIETVEWLEEKEHSEAIKQEYYCDSHAFPVYPENTNLHVLTVASKRDWEDDFGHALVSREPKGIAVCRIAQPKIKPERAGA